VGPPEQDWGNAAPGYASTGLAPVGQHRRVQRGSSSLQNHIIRLSQFEKAFDKLERGQKRATKIICLLEKVLYPERFKEFNLFSSSERRLGEALITVYKYFHREKTTGIKGLSRLSKAGITRSYGQELKPGKFQASRHAA